MSKVGAGVGTAQLIGLTSYPIISRIYTPAEFGTYTLFSSSVIIGSIIITGTYEYAIPLAKSSKLANKLAKFCLLLSASLSLIILGISILLEPYIVEVFPTYKYVLYLVPFGILLHAWLTIKSQFYTYYKSFKQLAISKISQTSSVSIIQIITGLFGFGTFGLIAGHLSGRVSYLSIFAKDHFNKIKLADFTFTETARAYVEHPKFVLPSSLIDALAKELPIFLILPFFGDQILGQYALAFKVLITPVLLISSSINSVFFQDISSSINQQKLISHKLIKIWGGLFLIGIVPFGLIFFWGETLFAFIFGDSWKYAGDIASILTLMLLLRFIFIPTSKSFLALQQQKWLPVFSTISLAVTFVALYIGYLVNDFIIALTYLTISQALLYFVQISVVYFYARKYENTLP